MVLEIATVIDLPSQGPSGGLWIPSQTDRRFQKIEDFSWVGSLKIASFPTNPRANPQETSIVHYSRKSRKIFVEENLFVVGEICSCRRVLQWWQNLIQESAFDEWQNLRRKSLSWRSNCHEKFSSQFATPVSWREITVDEIPFDGDLETDRVPKWTKYKMRREEKA